MLTGSEIKKYITKERIGRIFCLDSTVSTNLIAAQMTEQGVSDGTVVIADTQTAGAGRLGRSFYSPAKAGIYLSYIKLLSRSDAAENSDMQKITKPSPVLPNLGLLTSLAGLSVCSAITEASGLLPQIKWPNDIIIDNKKVCGILTKLITDSKTNQLTHAIIGIGINVNQAEGDFPADLSEKAGSLRMVLGYELDRAKLCADIINRIDTLFFIENALFSDAASSVNRLRELSCTLGKKVTVSSPNGEETVFALDIAPDGGLIVKTDTGTKVIISGEISG